MNPQLDWMQPLPLRCPHYFRHLRALSRPLVPLFCALILVAQPLAAQYAGRVSTAKAETPTLRAVAVLEWTGADGQPKSSRLVPVCILDQGKLQDAGLYLARPLPLALGAGTAYELQRNGKPFGLFELQRAGQLNGVWAGYGLWKNPAPPKPKENLTDIARNPPSLSDSDDDNDKPVLHRKAHPEDGKGTEPPSASNGQPQTTASAPADDPDRPVLRRKDAPSSTTAQSIGDDQDKPTLHRRDANSGTSQASAPDAADDTDRPTLRRNAQTAPPSAPDPDRPTLKKAKAKPADDPLPSAAIPNLTDPDRPRLRRGKSEDLSSSTPETPTLMGLPVGMNQVVAVSDAQTRPVHTWEYTWADPADELKMKEAIEQIARDALELNPPPAPAPIPARTPRSPRKPAVAPQPVAPSTPPSLVDVNFRVFELAYGSGATMVYSAHTEGPLYQQKFITLVAQPDLYGKPLILLKSITGGARLDESPILNLIDAVDALADNRGELLFELRGLSQRQFVLYRILRGQTEQIFTSAPFYSSSSN